MGNPDSDRSRPLPPPDRRSPRGGEEGLPANWVFRPEWEITPARVAEMLRAGAFASAGQGRAVLLDCRRDDEWSFARIDGAVWIPMEQTQQRADELEEPDGGRARPIVVYCHHGRRSLTVAATLRAMGFSDVRSMAGGIEAWSAAIDPSVPRY